MSYARARWLALGVAAVVLVAHSLMYNFVTDDAYISFVFSRNFAEHGQLVFNLDQPVEGYTNFLWTFVLGVLMLVGVPPEFSSRLLGTACALAVLFLVFRVFERALARKSLWACVAPALLACASGFACWTSGGLETQLFTMLVVAALDGLVEAAASDADRAAQTRALRRMAICLALSAMTRPEGLMIAALFAIARYGHLAIARRWLPGRADLLGAAWFVAIWAPWFAWRWWYYGWPFPNTYYVKASGDWADPRMAVEMREHGLYYIWIWLKQTELVYALPVALFGLGWACVRFRDRARFALASTCALVAIVYVPYTVSVGGDFMGLHRFIMPLFVVAAIAVVLGLEQLARWVPENARVIAPCVVAVVIAAFAITQVLLTRESLRADNLAADHGVIDTPAYLMLYTEDRAAIGRAMAPCFHDDDFSIVGGAGAQPYLGRMRGIDVFGLVSERIAHEEKRIRPRAGHTKFGSDELLAQYDPTFVFSCYTLHADAAQPPLSKLPCNAQFWTSRGYEELTMHVPGARQFGEYYSFFAKKSRHFECPGLVR